MNPIDLQRHAVVEASAGTGKTYTIERLVGRLLLEERVRLEQILLVTFTDKATAELKERLRGFLEKESADAARRSLLLPALDAFDQASIFTIHGFCQRVLSEYALENHQDFGPTLTQDMSLFEPCLREVQRRVWRHKFGDQLPHVLEAAGYCSGQTSGWEAPLHDLVRKFRPECGHVLLPAPRADWPARDLAESEPGEDFAQQLQVFTLDAVLKEMATAKKARGLHTFDDMIARVAKSLDPANPAAPRLLRALQERYRFGIVDEFQDTDPLQWAIFRRLFLESGTGKLFVVGDPKQAIFSFRNADLPTYLRAVREMTNQHQAASSSLTVNWRSCPELLAGLNRLFRQTGPEWFTYHDVQAPPPEQRPTTIEHDPSGRPALALVDVRTEADIARPGKQALNPDKAPKASEARKEYGWFIAREIHRLLNQPPRFRRKGREKTLEPGDICILFFKRTETPQLIQALRDHRIPFTYYKQPGLWTTSEAQQMRLLVRSLTDPEDHASWRKLLLTPLFSVSPETLEATEDQTAVPTAASAAKDKLEGLRAQWQVWAQRRQWGPLFQSVLERTGVILRGREEPNYDRRLANYRHLTAWLAQAAYRDNLDIHGLDQQLRHVQDLDDVEEGDLQPIETDRAKVKLMTVHASKGLEFPIVFLAGGFTYRNQEKVISYRDAQDRKIWNLETNKEGKAEQQKQVYGEQRRLLYVALTRAMCKLYVPWSVRPKGGTHGALTAHLTPLLEKAKLEELGPTFAQVVKLSSNRGSTPAAIQTPTVAEPKKPPGKIARYVQEDVPRDLAQRRLQMQSFSSLQRQARLEAGAHFGQERQRPDDDVPDALAPEDPLRGAVFGQLVHDYLEKIDFAAVGQATRPADLAREGTSTRRLLDQLLAAYLPSWPTRVPRPQLAAAAIDLVTRLAFAGLHVVLPGIGLPLWRIPQKDRLHEVEFQFPHESGQADLEEVEVRRGFLTGFIDLVIRHQERYFLLDWKTNLLDDYGPSDIQDAMNASGYHRQYRLYLQALARWLDNVHGLKPPALQRFGGVYYLFLRGMEPPVGRGGIFHHQPNTADLDLGSVLDLDHPL